MNAIPAREFAGEKIPDLNGVSAPSRESITH